MDFESALNYLESFSSYEKTFDFKYDEKNFDLKRFGDFVDSIGVDYSNLKIVHVAGSKGKGSVCGFLAEYIRKTGFKVGLFTSPHLVDFRERIKISGEMILESEFISYVEWIRDFLSSSDFHITYFEALTVIALKYFSDKKVDYAVLEVGLGGRLDSTNIVAPQLSILTRVEMEHVGVLGNTLEEIISEKMGILKKGVPFLVAEQSSFAMEIIKNKFKRNPESFFVSDFENQISSFCDGIDFSRFDFARLENLKTCYCAVKLLFEFVDRGVFKDVSENFFLKGRVEVFVENGKTVVFDVAHTVFSVENLVNYLRKHFPGREFIFLVSFLRDKNLAEIGPLVSGLSSKIILTSTSNPRAFSAQDLACFFKGGVIEEDMNKAFNDSLKDLKSNQVLVVLGSHYLVGSLI